MDMNANDFMRIVFNYGEAVSCNAASGRVVINVKNHVVRGRVYIDLFSKEISFRFNAGESEDDAMYFPKRNWNAYNDVGINVMDIVQFAKKIYSGMTHEF